MTKQTFIYIPSGYAASLTTDSLSSGSYVRKEADGVDYTPTDISASSSATIGPFNGPRNYMLQHDGGEIAVSIALSGVFTAVDEAAKADLASPVFTGTPYLPTQQIGVTAYASNGALAKTAGVAKLSKAGVGAYTLAAPTDVTDDGLMLVITSTTANAHVVTATGLIQDGVTGGAKDTATFAAFAGASITLMALGAKWHVLSANAVTIA